MRESLYIGIMSGTSLDGVDAALVDFNSSTPSLVQTYFLAYDKYLREQLLALNQAGYDELHRAALLSNKLSRSYADAVEGLLGKSGISSQSITAIGCHGQTVRHCPQSESAYSIQLGNAALLAELTGITVVADFRNRDIAAGGQGAPLVPAFHQVMFGRPEKHRIIVNIGGIANITSLSPKGEVIGFDCGPGNILMDAWCLQHKGSIYDHNGSWAETGCIIPGLLEALLAFSFFSLPPPKSTGREMFNSEWLKSYLHGKESPKDVQATLLRLSVEAIAQSIKFHFPEVEEIYLCGGGARNGKLVAELEAALPGKSVNLTDMLGIDADWMEAFAFAWLAKQTISKVPGNLPSVTGAQGHRILGAIYTA
ncbi:anhydro-N-acetylmuramic acid kinase [Nitrosomonas sp. Is37]|uniref:anhydro-N-acetylmuramic acid kinase n=1 Tax=Nitrosomonas sp. Is37 TaxID=3080535 RepID=UPI00294AE786|nr:anhydro-N-acetylmuramic acid kinase [Nitrosomonas sp. Is37]MDV6344569.1 anhydro-N-acetylmuramic acid kinase [Nitrosomonas sp. Is37]